MNPGLLKILFHLGSILKVLRDGEQVISDIAHNQPWSDDAKQTLIDVMKLLESGIIEIPGMSTAELKMVLVSIEQMIPDDESKPA